MVAAFDHAGLAFATASLSLGALMKSSGLERASRECLPAPNPGASDGAGSVSMAGHIQSDFCHGVAGLLPRRIRNSKGLFR